MSARTCDANVGPWGVPERTPCGEPAEFVAIDRACLMPLPSVPLCPPHAEDYRSPGAGWRVEPLPEEPPT